MKRRKWLLVATALTSLPVIAFPHRSDACGVGGGGSGGVASTGGPLGEFSTRPGSTIQAKVPISVGGLSIVAAGAILYIEAASIAAALTISAALVVIAGVVLIGIGVYFVASAVKDYIIENINVARGMMDQI